MASIVVKCYLFVKYTYNVIEPVERVEEFRDAFKSN